MKKALFFLVTIVLCIMFVSGCAPDEAKGNAQEHFCRVVCLKEDGIVVDIEFIGYVYVKNLNTDLEIAPRNTVVIKFSEGDLKTANGTFNSFDGRKLGYSYVLEGPESIRFPDTSAGEPTFG